ncbi:MAG TPA: hypothetical protein VF152_01400 [Acidimicrobiia bacterium]
MTDTKSPGNERDARAASASEQAVAWIARQLRWERTLADLRAGRDAARSPLPTRKAA